MPRLLLVPFQRPNDTVTLFALNGSTTHNPSVLVIHDQPLEAFSHLWVDVSDFLDFETAYQGLWLSNIISEENLQGYNLRTK